MLNQIKKTVEGFTMLENGDRVIVAVSGGVDSVVLLHLLMSLKDAYKLDLIVIHMNHSMRGDESIRDFVFVKNLAKETGLKFIGKTVDVNTMLKKEKGSPQEVARELRYKFFEDAAKRHNANKIATAHTLDDHAETILMRIIKGVALKGLRGIPFVRGKFIRPLLEVEKTEIIRYAKQNRITFLEDSSNKKTKYLRNRLRLELLPILQGYNPKIKQRLAKLAASISIDINYMENESEKAYKRALADSGKKRVIFNLNRIKRLPDALKTRIFLKAIKYLKGGSADIYSYHLEDIVDLINLSPSQSFINLPMNITVYREYEMLIFAADGLSIIKPFEEILKVPGITYIKEIGRQFKTTLFNPSTFNTAPFNNKTTAYFDYNKLNHPLVARNFRTGDRFKPFGMNGSKKVKDLFIEKKMPFHLRKKTPILTSGKEIIWVADIRRGNAAIVDKNTKRILRIEIIDYIHM